MAPSTKPTEHDNLLAGVRGQMAKIHTLIPGIVDSYDEETQTATVRPAVKFAFRKADGGLERYSPGSIPNVPVAFPGSGDFSITWPLEPGESVLLGFCERSIDEWKTVAGEAHEPADARRFDLSDAIAIPCLRSPATPIPAEGLDAAAMVVRATELRLGSASASDYVALASLVESELGALWTALHTHLHGGITPGGGVSSATIYVGAAGSVGATKVKAE